MRIAVAAKGGSSKTTTAATLARLFAWQGYRVTAIDDDPNPNLSAAIGLTPEQRAALGHVPREEMLRKERPDGRNINAALSFGERIGRRARSTGRFADLQC